MTGTPRAPALLSPLRHAADFFDAELPPSSGTQNTPRRLQHRHRRGQTVMHLTVNVIPRDAGAECEGAVPERRGYQRGSLRPSPTTIFSDLPPIHYLSGETAIGRCYYHRPPGYRTGASAPSRHRCRRVAAGACRGALPAGHTLLREGGGAGGNDPVEWGNCSVHGRSPGITPTRISTRTSPMPLAVSNSSPLIHLSLIGRIDLLQRFSASCAFSATASDL